MNTRGSYCLLNETFIHTEEYHNKPLFSVVYEVIRFIDGMPLFFDEHYLRLIQSLSLVDGSFNYSGEKLLKKLIQLATLNEVRLGNLMLKVVFGAATPNLVAYFIPHHYPTEDEYLNGVRLGLLFAERTNPKAKVENITVRELANNQIQHENVYEVLLVDRDNHITEGSRSNFFAIQNGGLYTAPIEKVLQGITMLKTIQIARQRGIPVFFKNLNIDELDQFNAAFITGTSPKILPVSKIRSVNFSLENPVLRMLMGDYEQLIKEDIAKRRDSVC